MSRPSSFEPGRSRVELLGTGSLDYTVIGVTRSLTREAARRLCGDAARRLGRAHFIGEVEALESVQHHAAFTVRCRHVGPPGLTEIVLLELVSFDPWVYLREEWTEDGLGWRLLVEPGYMPSVLHVWVKGEWRAFRLGYGSLLPLDKMGASEPVREAARRLALELELRGFRVAGYATHKHGVTENLILVADREDLSESVRAVITREYTTLYWFSADGSSASRTVETGVRRVAELVEELLGPQLRREGEAERRRAEPGRVAAEARQED